LRQGPRPRRPQDGPCHPFVATGLTRFQRSGRTLLVIILAKMASAEAAGRRAGAYEHAKISHHVYRAKGGIAQRSRLHRASDVFPIGTDARIRRAQVSEKQKRLQMGSL